MRAAAAILAVPLVLACAGPTFHHPTASREEARQDLAECEALGEIASGRSGYMGSTVLTLLFHNAATNKANRVRDDCMAGRGYDQE